MWSCPVRVLDWLVAYPWLPLSLERMGPGKPCTRPTKGELRRWCRTGSVLMNGARVQEHDEIPNFDQLGIWQLVFHPNSPHRCTMVQDIVSIETLHHG